MKTSTFIVFYFPINTTLHQLRKNLINTILNSLFVFISIGTILLLIVIGIIINNQIIAKKNRVLESFGSIDIYLKKRFDLLPNLISTLKKYLQYEQNVLLKVTELRSQAEFSEKQSEKIEVSNEITKVLGGLNLTIENYPDLKADKQFLNLQYELANIEDMLSAARRAYNASVTSYNNKIQQFPASLIAKIRKDQRQQLLIIPKKVQEELNINELINK